MLFGMGDMGWYLVLKLYAGLDAKSRGFFKFLERRPGVEPGEEDMARGKAMPCPDVTVTGSSHAPHVRR